MIKYGLSGAEALRRLREYGPNLLPEKAPTSLAVRFLNQFRSPLIYILLVALAVDIFIWSFEGAVGYPFESIAIGLILLINAGLGVYQEAKAEAALSRLKTLAAPLVWVVRDGVIRHLPGSEIVPGDFVRIEAGDRVPADGLIHDTQGVMIDESLLTGESVPVDKSVGSEVFSGTLFVRGKGVVRVTRTGPKSAMGKLATMIGTVEEGKTPLEARLEVFGRQIAYAILILAVFLVVAGIYIEGADRLGHVLLFAVALAVAAVPEGLPAVLTLTLSLGVERMAKRKAVVRRLSAVEALGSVTVIATDKTGTLTENKMTVKGLISDDRDGALKAMVFANDAEFGAGAGDPLEIALLVHADANGVDPKSLADEHPRTAVVPFDSRRRFMRVTVRSGHGVVSYLKGAPEVLIERSRLSAQERRQWSAQADEKAAEGYRIIALAWRDGEGDDDLTFGGLALLWDPPRPEVPQAIAEAREAGIRVLMITGDHPATAQAIAREVGFGDGRVLTGAEIAGLNEAELATAIADANVFARMEPGDKLRLVTALQASGEVVAVTGDGVNDAPALKKSDVGVAMGERGSDVSREVADLVLLDDNFATIVAAIEEGRSIYENIQKFIRFLFSTNFALVLLVVGGSVGSFVFGLQDVGGGLLLPLTAVQLLWINIIADGPPALALGLDRNDGVMRQSPRDPRSPLLDRASVVFIVLTGTIKAAAGGLLLIVLPLLGYTVAAVRTAVFVFESVAQLFFAYPSRHVSVVPRFNAALHLAVGLGVLLQVLTLYVPFLRELLGLTPLDGKVLLIIGVSVLFSWGVAEAYGWLALRRIPQVGNLRRSV